jgi:hypothetical protein
LPVSSKAFAEISPGASEGFTGGRALTGTMRPIPMPILLALAVALPAVALADRVAQAQGLPGAPAPLEDIWRVRSAGPLTVDGGLLLGSPAALATGMSTGVGGGAMIGNRLSFGARASWSTATESSIAWTLTRADLRLRAAAAIQHAVGRGRFALRLGLGPTIVHETRVRNQGARAGLSGSDLQSAAWVALPTGELEAVVAVHVAGPWLLQLAGGPGLALADGGAHAGWTAGLAVGWQP